MYASASIGVRSNGRMRGNASASIVPRTQATAALPSAMSTLRRNASVISGVRSATSNQRVENPSQRAVASAVERKDDDDEDRRIEEDVGEKRVTTEQTAPRHPPCCSCRPSARA